MVRSKASSKKPQARGVDFKKYKKKLGRKLPPPTTATNTQIKSKAIILPEQSVALNKEGVPVSKKGLTLKELLQQSSHHNAKVRKDALRGIEDILLEFPEELKLHKNAIFEKLRERICDDDKEIRDKLYKLFVAIISTCKEDIQGAPISLIMAYIFKAMTHLVPDVRFMAFKFFDILVRNHPPAFFIYAEKGLDNAMDLLQKSQFHLEDKSKLKFVLRALADCLSLLPSNERKNNSSGKIQGASEKEVLHSYERDVPKDSSGHILIFGKLKDLVSVLVKCLNDILSVAKSQPQLDSHSFGCMRDILKCINEVVQYNVYEIGKFHLDLPLHRLFGLYPIRPTQSLDEEDDHYDRRYRILNSIICRIFFTFNQYICQPYKLCDKFLCSVEGWLSEIYRSGLSDKSSYDNHLPPLVPFIPHLLSYLSTLEDNKHQHQHRLLKILQVFTMAFKSCSSESSMKLACLEAVEELLILKQEIQLSDAGNKVILDCEKVWINEIGLLLNAPGNSQKSSSHVVLGLLLRLGQIGLSSSDLAVEYDKLQDVLEKFYSLSSDNGHICFMELPKDSQEISICCLYYFSSLKAHLLNSVMLCCLSDSLDSSVLLRIVEVLHLSYEAGHIHITDFISFLVNFLSQCEVCPEPCCDSKKKEAKLLTFRSVTGRICSFLSQMGDQSLLSQILEDVVLDRISRRLPIDNTCALMGMLITVDCRPSRFSGKLGDIVFSYMIDVALLFPENEGEITSNKLSTWQYYLLPCFILLAKSPIFLLDKMGTFICESCDHPMKIKAIVAIFKVMSMDAKMQSILSSCKAQTGGILRSILLVQSSVLSSLNIEQQHNVQIAVESMKNLMSDTFSIVP